MKLPFRQYFLCLVVALCGLVLPGLCPPAHGAARPLKMETEDQRLVTWDLSADSVTSLSDAEIMEAKGNVYLRRGKEYLKADFARYYVSTNWVYLKGNVLVRMGQDELKAEEAEFDLRSRVGWLKNGTIFMAGPHAYLSGARIDKHWGDVYSFRNAKVTTCDGDSPAWSFTAEEAVVEIDGYARLSRAKFQVKDQPVAYTPYFVFPAKTKRQTGLLVPEYGRSTTKGFYYSQPFFWAINESSDLTVNEYAMEKRGFMHGVEYRTRPTADSAGWIRFDWMYDQKRVRNDGDETDYTGDGLVRSNSDRYWIRGMYDARLPDPDWRIKVDLDYVSDQYFLPEFKNDFSGFKRSRDELFNWFHRDLTEKDQDRESGFLLTKDWQRATVALSAQYTQDQTLGNGNTPHSNDSTVQRLPMFDAFLHKGRIFQNLPLEAEASFQAGYMYRRNGTRGARYEVNPRITLPMNSRYGSIIATAGVRETYYDTERASYSRDRTNGPREYDDNRTLPEFSIASFTEFARVYTFDTAPLPLTNSTVGKTQVTHLRHSIQPRVEFFQRANEDQDRNPYYDSEDRLLPKSELVYSLTNVLTRKRETVELAKNEKGEDKPVLRTSYEDLVRLRIAQGYDYREANRDEDVDTYERRPFSDIFSDLEVYVTPHISLLTRNNWSPYLSELTRHQSGVQFSWPQYGRVYTSFDLRRKLDEYARKRDDDIRYLRVDLALEFLKPFTLEGSYRYDLENSDNHETEFRLVYNHQCFQIIGGVYVDPQEENYHISVVLFGLGDN